MGDQLRNDAVQLLKEAIVIDGLGGAVVHPTPHVAEGTYEESVLKQGWSAFHVCLVSEPSYTPTWEQVQKAIYENLVYLEVSPNVRLCEKIADVYEAKRQGQLGIFFGLQSTSCIEQDRTRIRLLHKLGLRVLQLTYMERNFVGDGCLEPENRGLTNFGIQVVRECNRLGIVVDCSHVGVRTSLDAARYSENPIVVSHSAVRALTDNPRCLTDEQIKAVADKGGLVGITAYAPFIRYHRRPTLDDYVDHFEYAMKLVGPDHVALATDMFDGKTKVNWATPYYYPEVTRGSSYGALGVEGFNTKSELINVAAAFLRRGHKEDVIKKILGGNWLRVLEAVWH
jgi:membrane dipeptidase